MNRSAQRRSHDSKHWNASTIASTRKCSVVWNVRPQAGIDVEKVETSSGIAADECSVNDRPRGRGLDRSGSSGDVEGQRGVVLHHAALKASSDAFPERVRRSNRGMNRTVEDESMVDRRRTVHSPARC